MLFNPEFTEESQTQQQPLRNDDFTSVSAAGQPLLRQSYDMFSPPSPSPTRSMIKEANDHLQLLHQRVAELERTVKEQAEALIKKDETMQARLRDLASAKDAHVAELCRSLEACQQRIQKLESACHDKDALIEHLGQRNVDVDELEACAPVLERLLASLRKLPRHHHHHSLSGSSGSINHLSESTMAPQSGSGGHFPTTASSKTTPASSGNRARKIFRGNGSVASGTPRSEQRHHHHHNSLDSYSHQHRHHQQQPPPPPPVDSGTISDRPFGTPPTSSGLSMAELRIARSFNINSNFSMSEDEEEDVVDKSS